MLTGGLSVLAAHVCCWPWPAGSGLSFRPDRPWKSQRSANIEMKRAKVNQWAMQAQTAVETQPKDALVFVQNALVEAEHDLASQLDHHTQDSIRNTLSHLRLRSKIGPFKDQVNDVCLPRKSWGRALRPSNRSQCGPPDSRPGPSGRHARAVGPGQLRRSQLTTCPLSRRSFRRSRTPADRRGRLTGLRSTLED